MFPAMFESQERGLPLFRRGKVRDVYKPGDDHLLIVACDRISAFDHVLPTPIPGKGRVLTQISNFFFKRTEHIIANHIVDPDPGPEWYPEINCCSTICAARPDRAGAQRPAVGDREHRPWLSGGLRMEGVPEDGRRLRGIRSPRASGNRRSFPGRSSPRLRRPSPGTT